MVRPIPISMLCLPQSMESKNMPKGPKGQKRPGDVVGAAVMVAKIATGEIKEHIGDDDSKKNPAAVLLGKKGGKARAKSLSAGDRKRIAQQAANLRWAAKTD